MDKYSHKVCCQNKNKNIDSLKIKVVVFIIIFTEIKGCELTEYFARREEYFTISICIYALTGE